MANAREKGIGSAIEGLWGTLQWIRSSANWERKLLAASYLHHRDGYPGTQVPRRSTYDSSAVNDLNTFLSGFVGYIMPQDDTWADLVPMQSSYGKESDRRRWSYATISDLDSEAGLLKFAERCVSAAMSVFANTDFYPEFRMCAKDYLVFGTGYIMCAESSSGKGVYYRCYDPQEVCIAEDEERRVNVFVRKFTMDARDIVRSYPDKPWTNLRRQIRSSGGERSDIDCYEAVFPKGYVFHNGSPIESTDGRPFTHVMYVAGEGELAFESGYDEFPIACIRRNRDNAKTPYGIGLIEECLDVIIELDDMGRIRQVMRQKNADPPMSVPYSLEGRFSSRPGARNYVSDMSQTPAPVVDHYDANELLADIQDMRAQLRSLIGADLFRTIMGSTDSRKTAYEVSERKNEAMTLLQMQIGTFRLEGIEPVFKRTLVLLERQGLIVYDGYTKKVRDSKGNTVGASQVSFDRFIKSSRIELNSVFVRRVEAYLQYQQNMQALQILQVVAQVFPGATLNIDENSFTRGILYGAGMPKAYVREISDTEQKQADMAKSMQQQSDAARLQELSAAAKDINGARAEQGGIAV